MALPWLAIALAFAPPDGLPQRLQKAVSEAMGSRSGSAVVVDVDSGQVLASHRLDVAARRLASPGSAVKPFTLLALLNARRVKPGAALVCGRKLSIDGRRLDCTHPATPLPLDATAALAYSCNFFFATFAGGLRDAELPETFARVGLSSPSGFARDEVLGWATPASMPGQRELQALGERHVEVTPLGLLAAYRKLAQRRKLAEPPDQGLRTIYAGLEAAAVYGTARLAQPPGVAVAGKTGTSGHAWFAGFAPAAQPRIAVVIFLERGSGGGDAAPIAGRIFRELATEPRPSRSGQP
ncbi:MAG: penicillin-binding transpeptidase domain-containing protein [Bryobacteraceae bacterium]